MIKNNLSRIEELSKKLENDINSVRSGLGSDIVKIPISKIWDPDNGGAVGALPPINNPPIKYDIEGLYIGDTYSPDDGGTVGALININPPKPLYSVNIKSVLRNVTKNKFASKQMSLRVVHTEIDLSSFLSEAEKYKDKNNIKKLGFGSMSKNKLVKAYSNRLESRVKLVSEVKSKLEKHGYDFTKWRG